MWFLLYEPPASTLYLTWLCLSVFTIILRERRYHQTVGRNCVIELAWSVNRSGLVHPPDAQRYAEFGKWIREQYGPPPHFNERYMLWLYILYNFRRLLRELSSDGLL